MKNFHFNPVVNDDVNSIISKKLPWNKLSGTKILITGASGFIGSYLIRSLISLNQKKKISKSLKILAITRNKKTAKKKLFDIYKNRNLKIIEWNINTYKIPKFKKIDYIFHCASLTSSKYHSTDPLGTLLPNTLGTLNLLKLVEKYSPKIKGFLFLSSGLVLNSTRKGLNIFDTSIYAESKRLGEIIIKHWYNKNKFPVYVARLFHTYGPCLKLNDGRLITDLVWSIIRKKQFKINQNLNNKKNFCYVTDAIIAILTILLEGKKGSTYNIANLKSHISISKLIYIINKNYPKFKVKNNFYNNIIKQKLPNINQLYELGWKPEVSIKKGLNRMIKSYFFDKI